MNRDRAIAWVEALESGDYEQARGCLENEEGNCCLGVLCRVAMADGLELETRLDGKVTVFRDPGDRWMTGFPPASVERWLGVSSVSTLSTEFRELWRLNDVECATFEEIAAYVRELLD